MTQPHTVTFTEVKTDLNFLDHLSHLVRTLKPKPKFQFLWKLKPKSKSQQRPLSEENKTQNQVLIFVKIKTQVKVLLKASDIYVTSTMSFKN